MFNLRNVRRGASSRVAVLLALLALVGTACSDLEGALPVDPPASSEDTSEDAGDDDAAGEDASEDAGYGDDAGTDEGDEGADAGEGDEDADAGEGDEDADAGEGDDGAEGTGVAPITADDVRAVCGDEAALDATAEELAPLVDMTPESFKELACEPFTS